MADYERIKRRPRKYTGHRSALADAILAKSGELSKEQLDEIVALLEDLWGEPRPCPYCRNENWSIGTELLELPIKGRPGHIPVVGVECDRCGNVVLLNAHSLGLLPENE